MSKDKTHYNQESTEQTILKQMIAEKNILALIIASGINRYNPKVLKEKSVMLVNKYGVMILETENYILQTPHNKLDLVHLTSLKNKFCDEINNTQQEYYKELLQKSTPVAVIGELNDNIKKVCKENNLMDKIWLVNVDNIRKEWVNRIDTDKENYRAKL